MAHTVIEVGQDLVGIYAYNGPEFVESLLGAFRARVAPFNVNYRYVKAELQYLLNDAGASALIYHAAFAPTLAEVLAYRAHVDAAMLDALPDLPPAAQELVVLGCHHEEQHQELLLTDLKHLLSANPLRPAYRAAPPRPTRRPISFSTRSACRSTGSTRSSTPACSPTSARGSSTSSTRPPRPSMR